MKRARAAETEWETVPGLRTQRWQLQPKLALFLLLFAGVPLALIPSNSWASRVSPTVLLLELITLAWASWRLAASVSEAERAPLRLTFWSFVYVWLGIAALAQTLTARNPLNNYVDAATSSKGRLLILIGLLAYEFGRRLGRPADTAKPRTRHVSPNRVLLVSLFALTAVPLLLPALGGIDAVFTSRAAVQSSQVMQGTLTEESKSAAGIAGGLARVPAFVALLAILRYRTPSLPGRLPLLALLTLANVFVNNPISNPRYWFGTVALALLFTAPAVARPRAWRWAAVFLIASLVLVFPYADKYRDLNYARESSGLSSELTKKLDYDATTQVDNTVAFVDTYGHTDGKQTLSALAFFVPRSMWQSKGDNSGRMIAESIGYPFTNISMPLWSEMYLDLGWPGLILAFLLLGAVSIRGDLAYRLADKRGLAFLVVAVMAGYQVIILRGALLQAMGPLVLLFATLWAISRQGERSSPAQLPGSRTGSPG